MMTNLKLMTAACIVLGLCACTSVPQGADGNAESGTAGQRRALPEGQEKRLGDEGAVLSSDGSEADNIRRLNRAGVSSPGDFEQLTDNLGRVMAAASSGRLEPDCDWNSLGQFWCDIVPLLALENMAAKKSAASGCSHEAASEALFSGKGLEEAESAAVHDLAVVYPALRTPQSRHIYEFLFGGSSEKISQSYRELSRSLCFERLDRLGGQVRFGTDSGALPAAAVCPLTGKPYRFASSGSRLCCYEHGLAFTHPSRKIMGQPDEIYRQLAMGYYNAERLHRLDEVILHHEASAVRPGETVADIGCGAGCYVWSMASGAGSQGRVFAQDIDSSVLRFVDFVSRLSGIQNVTALKASRLDPNFKPSSLDHIFMIDVLNVMIGVDLQVNGKAGSQAEQYLQRLSGALKPGGRLVVIDFMPYRERPHVPVERVCEVIEALGLKKADLTTASLQPSPMYAVTFVKDRK